MCIRQEKGHCCVTYAKCGDTYSWTLDGQTTFNTDAATTLAAAAAQTGTMCTSDYLEIVGATSACGSRYVKCNRWDDEFENVKFESSSFPTLC